MEGAPTQEDPMAIENAARLAVTARLDAACSIPARIRLRESRVDANVKSWPPDAFRHEIS